MSLKKLNSGPGWFTLALFLLFSSLACTGLENIASVGRQTPTAPLPAQASATATPSPTLPPPTASPSPTPTAAPPVATPDVDFADLSPYRQAMLAEFAADVDTVAAAGASQYYLQVTLEPASFTNSDGLQLSGTERIRYTNTEDVPLSEIYFRLYPNLPGYGGQMDVDTIVVDNRLAEGVPEADNSALRVPLPAPLLPGQVADITLFYQATVPTQIQQGFNIFVYRNNTAALAGFYPAIAVYDDEGWNVDIPPIYGDATYLDTSLYRVQLTVPQKMVVAASGSVLGSESNKNGAKTLRLASGPMRDFYLAMREDYQVDTQVVDGVTVNSYYPPRLEAGGQLALRYAADSLRVFNQYFGPYPYTEFDVVATPTTAGGVEYPGIVVIAEQLYGQEGGFFQHATVHEVAHQWWYGLVGNDQVDEPWLDESLTNYSTIIYWEEIEGEQSAKFILDSLFFGPYEQAKNMGEDRGVIGPVSEFNRSEYSTFVYGKGPLFFHALRQEVGDETYFEIMQTYYAGYKYKVAGADDLFGVIERVSGTNIEPLFETWLQSR